jgi:exonuclease III
MDVFKFATLNINVLASRTKVEMLQDFLRRKEIDILFLQEVAHSTIDALRSCMTYTSLVPAGRGTAMVTRNEITITDITRLPSGRGIAAEYRGIWLVKVYAKSGTAKRHARERFYNNELPYLLRASSSNMIVRGNFKRVLNHKTALGTLTTVRCSTD